MSFDPHSFSRNTGLTVFGAIASVAMAARANAQAVADETATAEAIQSWSEVLADRDAQDDRIAELRGLVATLTTERARNLDTIMLLSAELATAHQIIDDIAAGA